MHIEGHSDDDLLEHYSRRMINGQVRLHRGVVESLERQMIISALAESHGNQTLAARQLGIHRNTLRLLIKERRVEETLFLRRRSPRKKVCGRVALAPVAAAGGLV